MTRRCSALPDWALQGNASPIARAAADEVTASCDEDGVAHAIYRHIGGGAGMKYRLLALDLDGTLP